MSGGGVQTAKCKNAERPSRKSRRTMHRRERKQNCIAAMMFAIG